MKMRTEMGRYSSVVGQSVHLLAADGKFLGQVAIMCQSDALRDRPTQTAICEIICSAINAAQEDQEGQEDDRG